MPLVDDGGLTRGQPALPPPKPPVRRRFALLLALLGAGALASLVPSGCAQAVPCQLNSDCPFGYCRDGACQKSCADSARDCPPGYTCDQNAQCVHGGTGGGASSSSGTGGTGLSSSSGTGGTSTTSSSSGAATSSSSSTSTSSTSSASSATSSSTSGGTGNGHELDLCASDTDCASPLVCRPMVKGGAQRCTRTCSSSSACMTGTRCELISGSMYCAGDDTGRPCAAAATCNFGCLGSLYCTAPCNTGADCPNGYGCMGVGSPPTRICVKAETPCDPSDTSTCIGPAFCDVTTQMVVGGCTTACTSAADCPQRAAGFQPWTCDIASGGLCRRPPDVFGPLQNGATPAQYACNAQSVVVNVCNDAQHIDYDAFNIPNPPAVSCAATMTTPGIATDSCVDSCRYQGSCPFGFACTAVGNLGGARIGLCLPTGAGEVGAACVHDSQCAFGYCPSSGKCSRDCTADGVCPTGSSCVAGGGPDVEGQPFRRCQ